MYVYRVLHITEGDAESRFREFLRIWWEQAHLKAILAPALQTNGTVLAARVIEDPDGLDAVNPFVPLMLSNCAAVVDEFVKDHPNGRLAVILRPCELRTLVELHKRNRSQLHRCYSLDREIESEVILIGVDCPGTYHAAEFIRQVEMYGMEAVIRASLNSSPAGEMVNPLPRTTCLFCEEFTPRGTALTVGSIGIAQKGHLLLIACDEDSDASLELSESTDGLAARSQILLREAAISRIVKDRADRWADRKNTGLENFGDPVHFLASMTRCTLCADCLDACPLYHGELSGMLGVGGDRQPKRPLLSELVEVTRWLASCSGCGMCEEACTCGVPLASLVISLSHQIRKELQYRAGDPTQPLPWGSPC